MLRIDFKIDTKSYFVSNTKIQFKNISFKN